MTREQAIAVERLWAGLVRTATLMISEWHHHGEYDTLPPVFTSTSAVHLR